jgi:hypothetical protein
VCACVHGGANKCICVRVACIRERACIFVSVCIESVREREYWRASVQVCHCVCVFVRGDRCLPRCSPAPQNEDSPLSAACAKGHLEVVGALLGKGANVEAKNKVSIMRAGACTVSPFRSLAHMKNAHNNQCQPLMYVYTSLASLCTALQLQGLSSIANTCLGQPGSSPQRDTASNKLLHLLQNMDAADPSPLNYLAQRVAWLPSLAHGLNCGRSRGFSKCISRALLAIICMLESCSMLCAPGAIVNRVGCMECLCV